jgi:SNF2 family DNA or RNA helicase
VSEIKERIRPLFDELRELASPKLWSHAITIAKTIHYRFEERDGELKLNLIMPSRPAGERVSFSPEQLSYNCSCDDVADPCLHLLIGVIILHNAANLMTPAESSVSAIEYEILSENSKVFLLRTFLTPAGKKKFDRKLTDLVGGELSGRLEQSQIYATKEDFALDLLFGSRSQLELDEENVRYVVSLLAHCASVLFDATKKNPLGIELVDGKLVYRVKEQLQSAPVNEVLLQPELYFETQTIDRNLFAVTPLIRYPEVKQGINYSRDLYKERALSLLLREKFQLKMGETKLLCGLDSLMPEKEPVAVPFKELEQFAKRFSKIISVQDRIGRIPKSFIPEISRAFRKEKIETKQNHSCRIPSDFKGELRDYQKKGVDWLYNLTSNGCGALLADDMGLGKTVQVCAVLASKAGLSGKTLVIAPSSIVSNWELELKRFRPSLKVLNYIGNNADLEQKSDVVLVSYSFLRMNKEIFQAKSWDLVVLDEAQNIKNPDSQLAQVVCALDAKSKIALSGTPVENHLIDLWSIFNFLNPELLPEREDFRFDLSNPEDKRVLQDTIRPFILRRLKAEVELDLPEKTEIILYAEFSEAERKEYEMLLALTRDNILENGVFQILERLLRLRQLCAHPQLLPNATLNYSAKLELLLESLGRSTEAGHRCLVFSQWTSYLDLIQKELQHRSIKYLRLDGNTKDRSTVISTFQEDESIPVFLLSLKAGGVGLNLTAADHVYLTDPWWNPAVEAQARDRAHRIGQTKSVTMYKLIVKDSIEERILALQEKKKDLANALFSEDGVDETDSKEAGISRAELISLIQ